MHIDKKLNVEQLKRLAEHVKESLGDAVISSGLERREISIVCRKQDILPTLRFLRDDKKCLFRILLDVCGVDYPNREQRFDVVYHLLSVEKNLRIRVKVLVRDNESVPSATEVFSSANWYERETYDMFGIVFENHPDLRRILTDYGFTDFPLRKDFPVEGKVEVYYDKEDQRVAYKPVDMPQEYRHFDRMSPWEGMTGNASLADNPNLFDENEFNDDDGGMSPADLMK